ncbi:MAG: hypothetical protein HYR85_07715 [Planctomycetes bacterium]|nr:hypothetical protein [Planctomycetota bacterium]
MTRYGRVGIPAPNGSEFACPNTIICGARTRTGHQSSVPANRPEFLDIRLEDPNNPGYPDVVPLPAPAAAALTIATPAIAADQNAAPAQCPVAVGYQQYTFNGAAGIPDPLVAFFLTWSITPANSNDPCYLAIETSAPFNGRASYFNSTTVTYIPGSFNAWIDAIAYCPPGLTLSLRMHGSSVFPGDHGLPDWFIRADEGGTIVDDYVSATIVVDNGAPAPIALQTLSLVADPSVISPRLAPRNVAARFVVSSTPGVSLASGNPYSWPPGRTTFRASVPARIAGKFQASMPVNVPFVAMSTPPGLPPIVARGVLGARRQRGQIDDGTAELAMMVQGPSVTGDALAQRFPTVRFFPRIGGVPVTRVDVTRIDVAAVSIGSVRGFDAIEIRRDDPVLIHSADPSPQGLYGRIGIAGDGVPDLAIPADPNGVCRFFSFTATPPIPVPSTADVWVDVVFMPGAIGGAGPNGTFLCTDTTAATVLGESFASFAGAVPFVPMPLDNGMVRLVSTPIPFGGRPSFDPPVLRASPAPRPVLAGQYPMRVGR